MTWGTYLRPLVRTRRVACRRADTLTYSPHLLWCEASIVTLMLLLLLGPGPMQAVLLLLLIGLAITAPHGVVQSLSVVVLLSMANPGLAHVDPRAPLLKWLLICVCLARVALAGRRRTRDPLQWGPFFAAFLAVVGLLVLMASYDPVLSGFKLISFAAGSLAALCGFSIDCASPRYWLNWFFTLHCVVVFLSLPVLFLSSGYLWTGGRSFQGIFSDPQGFAVYLAMGCTYLILYILTAERVNLFSFLVAALTGYLIVTSHCRGAMLAVANSTSVAALTVIYSRRRIRFFTSWTVARMCAVALLVAGLLAYDAADVFGTAKQLALKGYTGSGDDPIALLAASFVGSRGEQVRSLVTSIAAHPLAGIGFGLAPTGVTQAVQRDPIAGLPISAPIEQGFLPFAVLAQIGVVGTVALCVFLLRFAAPVVTSTSPPVAGMFFAALLVNMGEMIFFSPGGFGLQMWLILGVCFACASHEHKPPSVTMAIRMPIPQIHPPGRARSYVG